MNNPVIETKGVKKSFGSTRAVKDLTLHVNEGEMFGFVGPDGAGKTTSIRMLCGITRPDEGTISVLGYDCSKDVEQIKKYIAYVSQKFSLYGDLSVDENIEFFAHIHRIKDFEKKREELLEMTYLTPFRKRLVDRLSGGMKQKVALACTLVHGPKILFLDEPTTGVDPVSRRDFWKLLTQLPEQGISIIMCSPYMDEAERCQRIALMHEGSIIKLDTPEAVKKSIPGTTIEMFVSSVRDAFLTLREKFPTCDVQAFGDRINFRLTNTNAEMPHIKECLKNITILDWHIVPTSLESAFISLIQQQPSGSKI